MNFSMQPATESFPENKFEQQLEQKDKNPKVEHLVFDEGKCVLIKTSFPSNNGLMTSYILVTKPSDVSQEEAHQKAVQRFGEMSEDQRKDFNKGYDLANKPHVFKGIDGAKEWLESTHWDNEDKEKIQRFLGL